jgi:hypothetical protein
MTRPDDADAQLALRRRERGPKRHAENERDATGKKCATFVVNEPVPEHRNLLALLRRKFGGFFWVYPTIRDLYAHNIVFRE